MDELWKQGIENFINEDSKIDEVELSNSTDKKKLTNDLALSL